ncbi:hypothetical protein DICPUDRAFT_34699 [Dictyostelium purpureum]|uniref:Enoyl reductase (ER) domain-containing protein n=1 Tax=Dictyostelium purpureum TaxID=5786 RepID=F0ZN69_DICPU|nr:uncharacterized protein DICPUDRAFT_34699 [Dictyostelium purpureum]EGC34630.1 hypothetical protein DICPUDRAFT_34699 [Dictyostelium purpureum]|eukprot:XP_003288855.1 hypothetical protein DICPUDRAFT_34699 [Dictyostelium purpureum]
MNKVAVFEKQNESLTIKTIPIPEPGEGMIRVKVIACGVCAGDELAKNNGFGNILYPIIPGHECIGVVDKLGINIKNDFSQKEMVGIGWYGGFSCNNCFDCFDDFPNLCKNKKITGLEINGGYAEYIICDENALVKIPSGMDPIKTAPLLCAGVTVYNSLKSLNLKKGAIIGIQGIGGLGHLGIQYGKKMGYKIIAISRGENKKEISFQLGADYYIDSLKNGYIQDIKKIGRVECIMITSPSSDSIQPMLESICNNGKLLLLSILDRDIIANSVTIVNENKSIVGWTTGEPKSILESLEFAKNNHIYPIVNEFTLDNAKLAQETINKANFRNVIKINEFK